VRHAGPACLDGIEPLLARVRLLDGLVEKTRGVFYRRSGAFLHFHEDPSGTHADVRLVEEFERFRVETAEEQEQLLTAIKRTLEPSPR
jgi:hypothetical protein